MFTQPIKALSIFQQGDSSNRQNRCLLFMVLSTNLTAKCELVFVLTQENAYS